MKVIVIVIFSVINFCFGVIGIINYYNSDKMKKNLMQGLNLTKNELLNASDLGRWSDYLGKMDWYEANKHCASLGMKLPKLGEWQIIRGVHKDLIIEKWIIKYDSWFWTSEEYSEDGAYFFNVDDGSVTYGTKTTDNHVRCIR